MQRLLFVLVALIAFACTAAAADPCPCCGKADCVAWSKYCAAHKPAAKLPVGCPTGGCIIAPVAAYPTATHYRAAYHEEVSSGGEPARRRLFRGRLFHRGGKCCGG